MRIVSHAVADEGDAEELGAFTCDFDLPGDLPPNLIVPILERDRMHMSARPGFIRKLVPLSISFDNGDLFGGGRYLFDSFELAKEYMDWVHNDFILDGVLFFDRPEISNPDCHAWSVIGAEDFDDVHTSHVVVRTERWITPEENQRVLLKTLWPNIRAEADARGLTSVWLLYNKQERLVSLVYTADRVVPPDPDELDFPSLFALAEAPSLGEAFEEAGWENVFDRTQWVLTIWFPFEDGDLGEPSVWPNSPPFPAP
jgi:hypothetical protein